MITLLSLAVIVAGLTSSIGCASPSVRDGEAATGDSANIAVEVEAAVWAFHRADTARDAEAVIGLLWPEFSMFVDGTRHEYGEIAAASRDFLGTIELFHTEWTDLRVTPLGPTAAVASFQFRDSIVTKTGDLIRSRGPTTFVWERRNGEWRIRFADSDHYPIEG